MLNGLKAIMCMRGHSVHVENARAGFILFYLFVYLHRSSQVRGVACGCRADSSDLVTSFFSTLLHGVCFHFFNFEERLQTTVSHATFTEFESFLILPKKFCRRTVKRF